MHNQTRSDLLDSVTVRQFQHGSDSVQPCYVLIVVVVNKKWSQAGLLMMTPHNHGILQLWTVPMMRLHRLTDIIRRYCLNRNPMLNWVATISTVAIVDTHSRTTWHDICNLCLLVCLRLCDDKIGMPIYVTKRKIYLQFRCQDYDLQWCFHHNCVLCLRKPCFAEN